eukprot:g1769.t1
MRPKIAKAWLVLPLAVLLLPVFEGLTVKICIPYQNGESPSFREQCTNAVSLANVDDLEFVCVEGGSADECISQLANGDAHLTTLDGGDVIRANRDHGIVPLISEVTRGDVEGGDYYAVAVVNKDFCSGDPPTLAELRGLRSCHTGYRKSAGWRIPVGTLLAEVEDFRVVSDYDDVEDDAESVAGFFDGVCAPRVSENGPMNTEDGEGELWDPLCTACKGDCSTYDQYYDYSGAFRCLMEGNGDVAFVKHTTVLDYAADGDADEVFRAWANKTKDEFRLLCRSGGCMEVEEYRDCHLSIAPSHAMVTSKELGYDGENATIGLQIQETILFAEKEREIFLNETRALTANFLWTEETIALHNISGGMDGYLPQEAQETFNAFDKLLEGAAPEASGNDTRLRAIYCAHTDEEMELCTRTLNVEAEIGPEIDWRCVQFDTIEQCLEAIEDGAADWRTVSGFDAYVGFARYNLTSVIAENGTLGNGLDYYSVALVRKDFCNENTTLADLQGTRSCHTGYRKNAGWDIPVGALLSGSIMEPIAADPAVENDAESVANFFNGSCAPHGEVLSPVSLGNTEYSPICSICIDNCTTSSSYAGYGGAYTCLVNNSGDVAFVKHTTVTDHGTEDTLEDFRLVCPNKPGCAPVDEYEDCHLGIIPTRSVVVSQSNPDKDELTNKLFRMFMTEAFINIVFTESSNPNDYIFHSDDTVIELKNGTEAFLGENLELFEKLEALDSEDSATVRVCIPYPASESDIENCSGLFRSARIPNLAFECIKGGSPDSCMQKMNNGKAHLTSLSFEDTFRAQSLYGLVPLIAEVGGEGINGSYYSVAVVNKDFCNENTTLDDLEDTRSCHGGYRQTAGWSIPVGTLISQVEAFDSRRRDNSIEDDAELVANFFSEVCAPQEIGYGPRTTADGKGALYDELCYACKGNCLPNDQYFDSIGAFRCLMEDSGDVAFVKHTTVLDYAADGNADEVFRAWANKPKDEFRLLCRSGGCQPVEEFEDCHLALVPGHALVGASALGPDGALSEIGEAIKIGMTAATGIPVFFEGARGLIEDFSLPIDTESFVPIEGGYKGYINEETEATLEALDDLVDSEKPAYIENQVIFCAASSAQMEACEANAEGIFAELEPNLNWTCVQMESIAECLRAVHKGNVDYTAANAAELYKAHKMYDLIPIAAEAIGSTLETSVYSVVLVKSEDCSNDMLYLTSYGGATACFSGYDTDLGWSAPISTMAKQSLIGIVPKTANQSSNAVASVVGFFGSVCAPHNKTGDTDADAETLCSACPDNCTTSGVYAGATGAVECLLDQEEIAVAVTDSSVFLNSSSDQGLRLLCPYRLGCAETSEVFNCNFGEVPTDAIVVGYKTNYALASIIQEMLIEASLSENYTSILGTIRDAGELIEVGGTMGAFLDEYEETKETMTKIETNSDAFSSSSLQIIQETPEGSDGRCLDVIVINKDFCNENTTLDDLEDKRSCHGGYKETAGWSILVGTLISQVEVFDSRKRDNSIEDDAELVANFFSEVCAPQEIGYGPRTTADGKGALYDELCYACKGNCLPNDQYFDSIGAFRCLMEDSGDVAFVKHTTVLDYAADGNADEVFRAWANKPKDEFRLLCRSGGCMEVEEFEDCHLALVPDHAMVGASALGPDGALSEIGEAIQIGITDATGIPKLFERARSEWYEFGRTRIQWDLLYDMVWDDPQLEDMRVSCAPFGGPIAIVRDSRKIVMLRGGSAQPTVKIFNCAGYEISRFLWTGSAIIGMGWTSDEQLIFVDMDGEVSIYNVHGMRLPVEYSLGEACYHEKVCECVVYSGGIVALTCNNSIWAITDLTDVRPQRLANIDIEDRPQCMAVKLSPAHGVEVLLACDEYLIIVDAHQAVVHNPGIGVITMISVSPSNQLMAVTTDQNNLVALTSDMIPFLKFSPPTDHRPSQIGWCGDEFLVLLFDEVLMLIGSDDEWLTISIDHDVQLVSEIDSLRIFTTNKHFLLRKVSQSTIDVLSTESDHAGRDLYLARQAYDSQDFEADVFLRGVKDLLPEAIDACIEVASESIDVPRQRELLKTATYGIAFASGYPNLKMYDTCRKLRILNGIRDPQVGFPMTMAQLNFNSVLVLISRLTNAHHHFLASKICESMELSQDDVLRHWACARISADGSLTDDEDLKNIIVDKLTGCKGVKYATIATHAQEKGRKGLAKLLLEFEICAADQVPLLLKLAEDERALQSAIESGDTDLVYYTMFSLYKKLALADAVPQFYSKILTHKQAVQLFLKYCKAKMPDVAKEIYRTSGLSDGEAGMCLEQALDLALEIPDDPLDEDRIIVGNKMEQINSLLKESCSLYTKTKKHDFQSKSCDEYAQLRKVQVHVDQSMGRNVLLGLSPVDTIKQCIRLNNHKAADDIRRTFGIPDKHFWWIKLKTLAAKSDWETLETFASSKKSPIGWEPFIKVSMNHGAPVERVER